jgi:hypothetical protein
MMSYERRGMGTNGKTPSGFPTGTMQPGELDAVINEQFVFDSAGRGMRREDAARQEVVMQQREAESQARRAEWTEMLRQRGEYCEQNPEACAAAFVPLCMLLELPWGAIVGAIASPKGERWGGAKWGAAAASLTCPTRIATARLGWFGGLANFGVALAAPIMAARYRLKRKEERGERIDR